MIIDERYLNSIFRNIISTSPARAIALLEIENNTLVNIGKAYRQAELDIVSGMKTRYAKIIGSGEYLTDAQLYAFARDRELIFNIEQRLVDLGVKTNIINEDAIYRAVGIADDFTLQELKGISSFEGLDLKTFARINPLQSEIAVNNTMAKIKAVTEEQREDLLNAMREQLRIATIKGEGIQKIAQRFVSKTPLTLEGVNKGVFKSAYARAKANARYGIIESANLASKLQYEEFNSRCEAEDVNIKIKKQAIAHLDDRTSMICIDVNGQIVEMDEPFDTLEGPQDLPPFHVNCRTSIAAWHPLFEKFGKTTQQMRKESEEAIERKGEAKKVEEKKAEGRMIPYEPGKEKEFLDAFFKSDTYKFLEEKGLIGSIDPSEWGKDDVLERIWKDMGYDNLPKIVSDHEFDKIIEKERDNLVMYRGLHASKTAKGSDYARELMEGKYYGGLGIHGNGTYFASGKMEALQEAGSYSGIDSFREAAKGTNVIVKATYSEDFKWISIGDLKYKQSIAIDDLNTYARQLSAEATKSGDLEAIVRANEYQSKVFNVTRTLFYDEGRATALLGYDGTIASNYEKFFAGAEDNIYVIVQNRSKLVFNKKIIEDFGMFEDHMKSYFVSY